MDLFKDKQNCSKCSNPTAIINIFPDGSCPVCWEKFMDNVPLEELEKPDFTKAIKF